MEALNPAAELAGMAAMLLFLSALWRRHAVRWGRNCAFLGVVTLGALAVYSHDVMNLPEICGLGVIGCAAGLMLGRDWPADRLPGLLAGAAGMAGLAAAAAALGAFRNPYAFGLLDEITDHIPPGEAGALALTLALGAMAGGGGVAMIAGRGTLRFRAWLAAFPLIAIVLAGAQFIHAPRGGLAEALVALGFLSGLMLVPRIMNAGMAIALASVGGVAGWSLAALGFLLQDLGMVMAGGLAGSMGSMLACRPLRPAARKGLADSGAGA